MRKKIRKFWKNWFNHYIRIATLEAEMNMFRF